MPGVSGGAGGGPFSAAIVGGLMPGTQDGWGTQNATKRKADSSHHRSQASNQRTIRTATLSGMEGKSAERLMKAHAIAEVKHNVVSDGHDTKASAYETGENALAAVRKKLNKIDADAHEEINRVLKEKMPFALKWAEIVKIVTEARTDAIRAVADGVETTLSALSRVLTETGQDKTVNEVVQGLDSKFKMDMPPSEPQMPDKADFDENSSGAHSGAIDGQSASFTDNHLEDNNSPASFGENSAGAHSGAAEGTTPTSNRPFEPNGAGGTAQGGGGATGAPAVGGGVPVASGAGATSGAGSGGGSAPRVPSGGGVGAPGGGSSSVPSVPEALTPAGLAKGFSTGMSTGAPAALESNAATSSVVNAASGGQVGPPPAAPVSGASSLPVVSGGASVHHVDSGPVVEHASASAASPAPAPVVQPMVAPPPPPMMAPPPPPIAPGPLPAYAADLRAAAAAVPPAVPPASVVPPAPPGGSV